MESLIPQLSKLYKFPKPDIFCQGIPARLPQAYKDFYKEWKMTTPSPVHYRPEPGKWKRNPDTGEVTPVQNIPIPVKFPRESHSQLWGGEGVVQGFEKRAKLIRRIPKFWTPTLLKTIVHSEQ
uniref:Uncharacterized protein n=1 Tax=Clastoptera arizonana TaxID=38151 RepID=A0A1B6E1L6_9HEMI